MKRILLAAAGIVASATMAAAVPVEWSASAGGNGNYYEFVQLGAAQSVNQIEATVEASDYNGLQGKLVVIDSQAEQDFLNAQYTQQGLSGFYLLGITDRDQEGTFTAMGGDTEGQALGFTYWASGEPNDFSAGEDFAVGWWLSNGRWNDLGVSGEAGFTQYLVEYTNTNAVAPVPLPASAGLLIAGLAGFGALRARRKT